MSISSSLYTAESALSATDYWMSVIGNNIANMNTVGFKASQADFADLFASTEGWLQFGHGVQLAGTRRLELQGAIEGTGAPLDLAVAGQGFFILRDSGGNLFYTRAGQFTLDADGTIVNAGGLALQGPGGNITLTGGLTLPGRQTTALRLSVNLDADETTPTSAFPAGPDAPSSAWFAAGNYSTSFSLYDSAGEQHDLNFVFRKTGTNTWEYRVLAKRSEIDPGAPTSADLRQIGSGTLTFDSSGALTNSTGGIGAVNWVGGAANPAINGGNLSFTGTTQFAAASAVNLLTQNGFATGTLTRITIGADGAIVGEYSNGGTRPFGQITLANFANSAGLDAIGDSLLAVSADSGAAVTGIPGQGVLGAVLSGSLEMSNVDLPQEFVNMILTQRSFQINSRVITVADQMYSIAANLK
ncbi:MAG TPA: flagellar hook protein FlgE [Candidatus Binatia bacterium]|jgi:flagellar hook protein FlgE